MNLDNSIIKMKKHVIQYLITNYHYSKIDAVNLVNDSVFYEMLKSDTDFVLHYSVEYWAKEIIEEENLMCV